MSAEVWFTRLTLKRDDAASRRSPGTRAGEFGSGDDDRPPPDVVRRSAPETRALHDRAAPERAERAAFLWREAETGRKFYLLGPRPVGPLAVLRIETKPYRTRLPPGDRLAFDLRLNATVARKGNVDAKGRSRRSDVAMDRMRAEEAAAQLAGGHRGARGTTAEGGGKRVGGMACRGSARATAFALKA